jgi:hypothetical protein
MRNDEIKEIIEDDEIVMEFKPKAKIKPAKEKKEKIKEQTNAPVTIALTPSQKKDLEQFAKDDDRSVSYIVRKLLEKHKIINKQ